MKTPTIITTKLPGMKKTGLVKMIMAVTGAAAAVTRALQWPAPSRVCWGSESWRGFLFPSAGADRGGSGSVPPKRRRPYPKTKILNVLNTSTRVFKYAVCGLIVRPPGSQEEMGEENFPNRCLRRAAISYTFA